MTIPPLYHHPPPPPSLVLLSSNRLWCTDQDMMKSLWRDHIFKWVTQVMLHTQSLGEREKRHFGMGWFDHGKKKNNDNRTKQNKNKWWTSLGFRATHWPLTCKLKQKLMQNDTDNDSSFSYSMIRKRVVCILQFSCPSQ